MSKKVTIATVSGLSLVILASAAAYFLVFAKNGSESASNSTNQSAVANNSATTTDSASNTSTTDTSANTNSTTTVTMYKDGTYSNSQTYRVPEGESNSIDVKITLSGDVIKDLTVDSNYNSRESERYVSGFESSIKSKVVGKKISDVNLSIVGGASLTTDAFTEAISEIQAEAKG